MNLFLIWSTYFKCIIELELFNNNANRYIFKTYSPLARDMCRLKIQHFHPIVTAKSKYIYLYIAKH